MSKKKSPNNSSLKICPPNIVKILYQLAYDTHQILKSHNIKYWCNSGTLLGAIRHSGIIPWDDDIDIGMMKKDQEQFLDLTNVFKKCGYSIVSTWFGFKIFKTNRPLTKGFDYSYPNLDIFMYHMNEQKKRYEMYYKEARNTWPNEWWLEEELFPLKELSFGEIMLPCPRKYKDYFIRMYGKDWNKIAYREYDHETEEFVTDEKIKVKLTPSMRQPAKPTEIRERKCVEYCVAKVASPYKWKVEKSKSCKKSGKKECYNNFNKKMGVYMINCDMHTERLEKFKKYAKKAGLNACRIPCILGKKITTEEFCRMIDDKVVSKKANMTPVEVSINMSHFNCLQHLVNSCMDYALICEDDIEVKSDFISNVNLILDSLDKEGVSFSILHLWNGNWMKTISNMEKVLKITDKIQIMKETVPYNAGAVCYIISRKYAEHLIKKFFPIREAQDLLMGSFIKEGNHLTLKMKKNKKTGCYDSPLLNMPCGGEWGTGKTTQDYEAPTIDKYVCRKCTPPKK